MNWYERAVTPRQFKAHRCVGGCAPPLQRSEHILVSGQPETDSL
jgi:hypothetical protein